jgi:hypothetical protein
MEVVGKPVVGENDTDVVVVTVGRLVVQDAYDPVADVDTVGRQIVIAGC